MMTSIRAWLMMTGVRLRLPTTRGRPMVCRVRSGGGSWSTASNLPVVIRVTRLEHWRASPIPAHCRQYHPSA